MLRSATVEEALRDIRAGRMVIVRDSQDRAATIRLIASPRTRSYDLVRPGHIFPVRARTGGVLARAGHTEASVDLVRLAGLRPVAVMCEILDDKGKSARGAAIEKIARRRHLKVLDI